MGPARGPSVRPSGQLSLLLPTSLVFPAAPEAIWLGGVLAQPPSLGRAEQRLQEAAPTIRLGQGCGEIEGSGATCRCLCVLGFLIP